MKIIFFLLSLLGFALNGNSQQTDIGVFYGKFYANYKSQDYGTGFRNTPKSQYSGYPAVKFNKQFTEKISAEATASFLAYQQYIGTRLYFPNFFSVYYSGNISLTCNYSFIKSKKFESRLKVGLGIGITPEMYQGEFVELFSTASSSIDSISRGYIKRDFTTLFPTICSGIDFSYKLMKRLKAVISFVYQNGFIKITEYDIYYNDGSGSNDQRAKQWGTGDFYGVQLGIRYALKDENGNRSNQKKK